MAGAAFGLQRQAQAPVYTPIEEISPVSFDLKQEKRRASLAEVIAIDISGSMGMEVGGKTKLELANEAAARSADLLGAGDQLGVEHVDTQVHWSVKLGPVTDKKAIDRAIRAVEVGGGGIFVDIALAAAYAELGRAQVNLKHVLLFSDGDDADQIQGQSAVVAQAMRNGITTSVIALGTGKDVVALEELSRVGSGRYYLIEDAARLPSVFAQETILAARSAIVEKPFLADPAARGAPIAGVAWGEAPELQGYVVTIPKGRATVHLTGTERAPGRPPLPPCPARGGPRRERGHRGGLCGPGPRSAGRGGWHARHREGRRPQVRCG